MYDMQYYAAHPWAFPERPLDPPDEPPDVICPACGSACDELYFNVDGNICGCDCCIEKRDAYEYQQEQMEAYGDDYDE